MSEKVKIENITHTTNFFIFPQDTNYHPPMVFGGKMLSEMDICAAGAVRRALYDSPTAKDALTVAVNNARFLKGAVVKDMIFMVATITKLGIKSLEVHVEAFKEQPVVLGPGYYVKADRTKMAEADFVFTAYDMKYEKSIAHNLEF